MVANGQSWVCGNQVVASVLTRLASQARVPIPASRYASGERRVEAWMDSIEKGTGQSLADTTQSGFPYRRYPDAGRDASWTDTAVVACTQAE
jgi:hypothetical protein